MPHSVFLGVVVLFSSGCRCGVGFVFLFVVSCFHFSVPISGWFFVVFFYTWISINLDAKIHENFAKILRNFDKNFDKIFTKFCYSSKKREKKNKIVRGSRSVWNYEP